MPFSRSEKSMRGVTTTISDAILKTLLLVEMG